MSEIILRRLMPFLDAAERLRYSRYPVLFEDFVNTPENELPVYIIDLSTKNPETGEPEYFCKRIEDLGLYKMLKGESIAHNELYLNTDDVERFIATRPRYARELINQPESCKSQLAKEREKIQELEAEIQLLKTNIQTLQKNIPTFEADIPDQTAKQQADNSETVNDKDGPWENSVTAICRALFTIFQEGRKGWVSGRDPSSGDTDSAGKQTFRALLKEKHPTRGTRCRVKAEKAAWNVLVENNYTHKGSRKSNS
jgi:hypothetical protein